MQTFPLVVRQTGQPGTGGTIPSCWTSRTLGILRTPSTTASLLDQLTRPAARTTLRLATQRLEAPVLLWTAGSVSSPLDTWAASTPPAPAPPGPHPGVPPPSLPGGRSVTGPSVGPTVSNITLP